jgi:Tfp pilus assembly PilM family ATPase
MNKKSFGLDIGTSTVKAVELSADKNAFKLNACIVVPTPPKGMLSESPVDEEEMAQVKKVTETVVKQAEQFVKKNPEKATLVAAGIGAALGAAAAMLFSQGGKKKK